MQKKINRKRYETSWLTYYWKKSDYYLFFILYPWNWHIFRMRFLRIGHCARLHTHALLTVQCVQYCYACRCAQNQFPEIMHMKLRWSEWWNICEIYYMLLSHFVSNIWEIKNIFLFFWYERSKLWPTRLKRHSVLKAAYCHLTNLWQFENCQVTAWPLPEDFLTTVYRTFYRTVYRTAYRTAWILP